MSYALIIFWLGGFKPLSSRPTQSHSPFASLKAPIKEAMTRLPKRKRNKKKDKDGFWFLALLGHQPTARQAWWLALSLHTLMLCTQRVKVGVRIRLVSREPQVIPDRSRPISFGPPSIGWCNCSIVWATSLWSLNLLHGYINRRTCLLSKNKIARWVFMIFHCYHVEII